MPEDKRISVELTDDKGNVALTLYSTTGDKRSKAEFEKAYAEYEKSGKAPTGYTALEPGVMNTLRKGFEAVNQPLQTALPQVGGAIAQGMAQYNPVTQGMAYLAEKLGLAQPGQMNRIEEGANAIGQKAGQIVGESVKTPEAAGMTAGMAAMAPLLGPVSAIGKAGQVAMKPISMAANALMTGIGGAAGGTVLPMIMGEKPDFSKTAADFVVSTASGAMSGFVNHFITKYVSPNMQEKVMGDILSEIKGKYPEVASNPNLLNIYASNKTNMAKLTQNMSQALRGENQVVADQMYDTLVQGFKSKLTVGEQNTFRKVVRDYARAGTELLDSIGNDEATKKANDAFLKSRQGIVNHLEELFTNPDKGISKAQQLQDRTAAALVQFEKQLENYAQGAQVLSLLKQSSAEGGLNINRFVELAKDKYMQMNNPLMQRVGEAAGQGQPLIDVGTQQTMREKHPVVTSLFDLVKNRIPGIRHVPFGDGPKLSSPLAWQQPKSGIPEIALGQQAGLEAMREFFGRQGNK